MSDQSNNEKSYGQIDISPTAIKSIVHNAVNQSYGIVGMASKGMVNGIAQLLSRDPHKGIEVRLTEETVEIDMYVIIEHGIRIKAVAETLQNTVKFSVEKAMSRPVDAVNVYVQGLGHVPSGD
ncbi:MAG: Asp23/Gls24 family envelope stress response protein [Chloroflexota bacterium]